VTFFENPPMLNIRFGTGAVGADAGAVCIFGYGSTKMMRTFAACGSATLIVIDKAYKQPLYIHTVILRAKYIC
jgi:hypothetical protein